MPRPRRPLLEGGWYHVTNRGVDRMDIFRDKNDRVTFLALLKESTTKHQLEIHAYCLMGNHYHLLVRSRDANLDRAIHRMASIYARKFNKKYGRDGPLFKARYHSCLIEDTSYLLAVTRYIHRNPLELGVRDLAAYEWSSYGVFAGRRRRPTWMTTTDTLQSVGGRRAYQILVEGQFESPIESMLRSEHPPTRLGPDAQSGVELNTDAAA